MAHSVVVLFQLKKCCCSCRATVHYVCGEIHLNENRRNSKWNMFFFHSAAESKRFDQWSSLLIAGSHIRIRWRLLLYSCQPNPIDIWWKIGSSCRVPCSPLIQHPKRRRFNHSMESIVFAHNKKAKEKFISTHTIFRFIETLCRRPRKLIY